MTTDANQKLCWDIAEAEGWEYHDESKSTWPWLSPKREGMSYNARRECSCPHYLTDPETVRMLKALIEYYCDGVWFALDAHNRLALHCQQWSIVQPECTNEVHVTDCDCLEIAVAQAYLAMLIERKEQG